MNLAVYELLPWLSRQQNEIRLKARIKGLKETSNKVQTQGDRPNHMSSGCTSVRRSPMFKVSSKMNTF